MTSEPIVRATNVHKSFRRGSEQIDVLQGVNLEIPQGEFLALMRRAPTLHRRLVADMEASDTD